MHLSLFNAEFKCARAFVAVGDVDQGRGLGYCRGCWERNGRDFESVAPKADGENVRRHFDVRIVASDELRLNCTQSKDIAASQAAYKQVDLDGNGGLDIEEIAEMFKVVFASCFRMPFQLMWSLTLNPCVGQWRIALVAVQVLGVQLDETALKNLFNKSVHQLLAVRSLH